MAKNKEEYGNVFKGTAIINVDDMTLEIGDEIINIQDKLREFNFDGKQIKFNFAIVQTIAEE